MFLPTYRRCSDDVRYAGWIGSGWLIDAFVEALDLAGMSFEGVEPAATGRPSYHPSLLLKL
jgi:hypothetical protein